jgi:hypothetical protein
MTAREQRLLLAAALGMSALLLAAAHAGHSDMLVYSAPLFLMAVPLLAGRYVGEQKLERLRLGRTRPAPRRPVATSRPASRGPAAFLPRGGRLIAEALAVRPPPLLSES